MKSKLDCSFEVLEKYWVEETIIANAQNWLECLEWKNKNFTKFN
jgi:hypothetical protein